jgi:WhiB family redox-sensing transcriptional regulator
MSVNKDQDFLDFGDAPCAETFPDMFFPDEPKGGMLKVRVTYEYENSAKKVCAECPYRAACLLFAMKSPELSGIWGGLTEAERFGLANRKRGAEISYTNRGK